VWAGPWNGSTSYPEGAVVSYDGALWWSTVDDNTEEPGDGSQWEQMLLGGTGGGGGGGGGHVIVGPDEAILPQEEHLQFTGNVEVLDYPDGTATVVNIPPASVDAADVANQLGLSQALYARVFDLEDGFAYAEADPAGFTPMVGMTRDGLVYLRGRIKPDSGGVQTVAKLPSIFAPGREARLPILFDNNTVHVLKVTADGELVVDATADMDFFLDGVFFSSEVGQQGLLGSFPLINNFPGEIMWAGEIELGFYGSEWGGSFAGQKGYGLSEPGAWGDFRVLRNGWAFPITEGSLRIEGSGTYINGPHSGTVSFDETRPFGSAGPDSVVFFQPIFSPEPPAVGEPGSHNGMKLDVRGTWSVLSP